MRFIHTSDFHLSKNLRLDDFKKSLGQIKDFALQKKVDFVLITGDIFHKNTPDNEARVIFKQFLCDLMNANIFIFVLLGTHDEANTVHALKDINIYGLKNIILMDQLDIYERKWNGCDIRILAVPHVSKYRIANPQEYAIQEITKLKQRLPKDAFNLFCGHFTVAGAMNSLGYGLDRFDEMVIPKELLEDSIFKYVALGHIHTSQELSSNPPVIYAGSIEKINFGERDNENQFIYFEDGKVEKILLTVRPMKQYTILEGESLPQCSPGSIVKLVIKVKRERINNVRIPEIVGMLKKDGVYDVAVELDIEETERPQLTTLKEDWTWNGLLEEWLAKKYTGTIPKEEILQELLLLVRE